MRLPNETPEDRGTETRREKGRAHIWSCKHLETGCGVINHATVFYRWAILRSAARCTVHFLPPESNLPPWLHSAGPGVIFFFFFCELFFRCPCSSVAAKNECLQCSFQYWEITKLWRLGALILRLLVTRRVSQKYCTCTDQEKKNVHKHLFRRHKMNTSYLQSGGHGLSDVCLYGERLLGGLLSSQHLILMLHSWG